MGNVPVREQIASGVWFTSITDPKFKLNRISVNLAVPLRDETAAENAIVPYLLRKGCREYPDIACLNSRMAELYGAYLDGEMRKHGGNQILNLSVQALDDRFALENEDMIGECVKLLCQVLFDPKLVGEDEVAFDPEDVTTERQYLVDTIDSLINDKRSYAIDHCVKSMCVGQPAAVSRYGTHEQAEALTPADAMRAYRRVLKTAHVEILFIGCGNPASAIASFKEAFASVEREPQELVKMLPRLKADEVNRITEKMDVVQGKLVMGFRVGDVSDRRDYNALRMMLAVYGGTPFSRLFRYVREKLSLCYYCASRYDRSTGIMLVDSGVEFDKKEAAEAEILNQLEVMRKGEFTEEEFAAARLSLVSAMEAAGDSLGVLEGYYFNQIFIGGDRTPAQEIEDISKITREDIIEAARRVTLDTVYFLKGQEGCSDEA